MPGSCVNVKHTYSADCKEWLVHTVNTGNHAMIVIEGMRPAVAGSPEFFDSRPQTFIGQYEMWTKDISEDKDSLINKSGRYERVNAFDPDTERTMPPEARGTKQYALYSKRDYTAFSSKTIPVFREEAERIIHSVKAEQKRIDDITNRIIDARARHAGEEEINKINEEYPRYQTLGKDHWLVLLFGSNDKGHNCASWCIEHLKTGGIDLDTLLPKPKKITKSACIVM